MVTNSTYNSLKCAGGIFYWNLFSLMSNMDWQFRFLYGLMLDNYL